MFPHLDCDLTRGGTELKITSELMKSPSSAHPLDAKYQSLRLGKLVCLYSPVCALADEIG